MNVPDACLRCGLSSDDYWYALELPGKYCIGCIDVVLEEYVFLKNFLGVAAGCLMESMERYEH